MSRMVGTVSRGIRAPIIRSGDDLVEIVTQSVLEAARQDGFSVRDRDVIAMTEAIVARAQGNYATVDDIAADVRAKLGGGTVGVLFPILSRNRFAICLRGIAKGAKKIVLMLSYPSDEVGNHLIDVDRMDEKGVDPYRDVLTLERYRELFGYTTHSPVWTMWTITPSSSGKAARRRRSSSPMTPKPSCPMPGMCSAAISIPASAPSGV